MTFVVEVGEERGWVQKCWCDTMADAEHEFEGYAGNGELVRIRRGSAVVKQGGGPQAYSPRIPACNFRLNEAPQERCATCGRPFLILKQRNVLLCVQCASDYFA